MTNDDDKGGNDNRQSMIAWIYFDFLQMCQN